MLSIVMDEPGAEQMARKLDRFEVLHASNLLEAEFRAALQREGADSADARALDRVWWVLPERTLGSEFETVLAAGYLRGADLWHVACCLYLIERGVGPVHFVTADVRQAEVAVAVGLQVVN